MNDLFTRSSAVNGARPITASRYNSFSGMNTSRQDKFQAREQRRWGDWAYWEIPAPVLWLETPYVLSPFDDTLFVAPVFVDIWD
ncbi:hypothetical protein [Silvibacterium acidisoli]|uniref:hypothetical protein n=1 Tax=Acidobacteriaceae bacterium ZG23-2 TaxID=2883246 RepID=UPI00406C5342